MEMEESPEKKTSAERQAELRKKEKAKRRRGFLLGLLVGQLLIVALDFGGEALLAQLEDRIRFDTPISLRAIVFLAMSASVVLVGLLIAFLLGLQGAGYVLGKKKVGFFTALGRGIRRIGRAAWALGLTLGVFGGTAWMLIPSAQWGPTINWMETKGGEARDEAREWVDGIFPEKDSQKDE